MKTDKVTTGMLDIMVFGRKRLTSGAGRVYCSKKIGIKEKVGIKI